MQRYVVGLAFNADKSELILIHKIHGPKCVLDKWNGVGGKIEPNEQAIDAMIREFQEETGVRSLHGDWEQFCVIQSSVHQVVFFWAANDKFMNAETTTDENVHKFFLGHPPTSKVKNLPEKIMGNLMWMVPLVCDNDTITGNIGTLRTDRTDDE